MNAPVINPPPADLAAGFFEALAIARLLQDHAGGLDLYDALREAFPHARRDTVYLAIGIAWADVQATLTMVAFTEGQGAAQ